MVQMFLNHLRILDAGFASTLYAGVFTSFISNVLFATLTLIGIERGHDAPVPRGRSHSCQVYYGRK